MKQKNLTTNTTIPPKRLEPQNSPPLFELWVTVILPPRSPTQPPKSWTQNKLIIKAMKNRGQICKYKEEEKWEKELTEWEKEKEREWEIFWLLFWLMCMYYYILNGFWLETVGEWWWRGVATEVVKVAIEENRE